LALGRYGLGTPHSTRISRTDPYLIDRRGVKVSEKLEPPNLEIQLSGRARKFVGGQAALG